MTQILNILLIEDDDAFAFIIQKMLRTLDETHHLVHARRISEGLQKLATDEFDIVLTDLTLPDAVRLQSVELIRAKHPELPVIVLTSYQSMEIAAQALQAGAQDFIVKDIVTPALIERVIWNSVERQKTVVENNRLIDKLKSQQILLSQKNERLKQLVDTAHRFADNVSHEFRTPLTVIREYAELVRDRLLGEINEKQSQFMDVIVCRVDDLTRMVDDMLDSSKLEAGIMGMHRVPTRPAEIIRSPLEGLSLKAQVRGIELTYDTDVDLPMVFCDAEKAGRVVTNLIANAIKFTNDGTGRVHVGMQHLQNTDEVEIRVSDNGPGIDPADLERIFERFKQLEINIQSSTKGFGLGLNIARELVDLNFGSITVESEIDHGTTFRFTVPVDNWPEIVRRYFIRLAANPSYAGIAVVQVRTADGFDEAGCRDIESFWRYTQRQTDLIRKTGSMEWILLLACSPEESEFIINRFKSEHAEVSRSRPRPLPILKFETLGCFVNCETDEVVDLACQPMDWLV